MDGVAQLTETALLDKIRQTRSEAELNQLIEQAHQQVAESTSGDYWRSFSSSLVRLINSVNPLYIEDPAEWDILRRARVLLYRQNSRELVS